MSTHETPFGTVEIRPQGATITAHSGQLYRWSHRPGAVWPCSVLDDRDEITATFDAHGLVDLIETPSPYQQCEDCGGAGIRSGIGGGYCGTCEATGTVLVSSEVPSDELNAWSSDVLREVLPESHPAYYVTVGQFD